MYPESISISGPYQAFLFDMDGTVLTSLGAANRVWSRWATARGLDPQTVLAVMHGVRAEDTVRRFAPDSDVAEEARHITEQEVVEIEGVDEVAGAGLFLAALPASRWAIVTSAPRRLALRRLQAAGLPLPSVLIAAEDVDRGKPDPAPYLKAAAALGVAVGQCLVWEDAPAGIAAGRAAGAAVIVLDSHAGDHRGATAIRDFSGLSVTLTSDGALMLGGLAHAAQGL